MNLLSTAQSHPTRTGLPTPSPRPPRSYKSGPLLDKLSLSNEPQPSTAHLSRIRRSTSPPETSSTLRQRPAYNSMDSSNALTAAAQDLTTALSILFVVLSLLCTYTLMRRQQRLAQRRDTADATTDVAEYAADNAPDLGRHDVLFLATGDVHLPQSKPEPSRAVPVARVTFYGIPPEAAYREQRQNASRRRSPPPQKRRRPTGEAYNAHRQRRSELEQSRSRPNRQQRNWHRRDAREHRNASPSPTALGMLALSIALAADLPIAATFPAPPLVPGSQCRADTIHACGHTTPSICYHRRVHASPSSWPEPPTSTNDHQ